MLGVFFKDHRDILDGYQLVLGFEEGTRENNEKVRRSKYWSLCYSIWTLILLPRWELTCLAYSEVC